MSESPMRVYADNLSAYANPDCEDCEGVGYVVDTSRVVVASDGESQLIYVVPCQTCIVEVWG